MLPIDPILSNALNGRPQRLDVTDALAIGSAVRAMAILVESDKATREWFTGIYGTVAVEALANLTTHT